jgi:predicted dehydrogenase
MVRVGFIGVGGIAQLSHFPMIRDLPDKFSIEACYDISPSLCAAIAKKYNIPKVYESEDALLADKDIDAVLVLTSDPLHCKMALKAIEAGKHVFIEKPVCMNSADVLKLMEAEARHPEVRVMVGYMRRYSPAFLKAKELLAADSRPVKYIRFRDIICEGGFYTGQTFRPLRSRGLSDLPQGALEEIQRMKYAQHSVALGEDATEMQRNAYQMLLGLGCHSFAAVRELVGLPKEVKAILTSGNGTHFVSLLQYDGFIGTYEMINDQDVVQFDASIEIYQGDRLISIKYDTPYLRYLPSTLRVTESTKDDTKTTLYGPDYHDPFKNELIHFHDCIENGTKPKTCLQDSLQDIVLFQKMARMVVKEG